MITGTRYRVEEGRSHIDITVAHSRQLFDTRDPPPFRERDLDEDAVEYLLAAAEEIPRTPLAIAVTISDEPEPRMAADSIIEAVRRHFGREDDQIQHRLREHIRRDEMSLVVGLTMLVAFLMLAELTRSLPSGPLREILREGLVITGWVAMWRPLEVLLDTGGHWSTNAGRSLAFDAPVSIRYEVGQAPRDR